MHAFGRLPTTAPADSRKRPTIHYPYYQPWQLSNHHHTHRYAAPFDRHDWTVERKDGTQVGQGGAWVCLPDHPSRTPFPL
jgi:hypothetical protein